MLLPACSGAWAWRVAVKHPRALVALTAPRWPGRPARRCRQVGRRKTRGKHRVRVPHAVGVRAGELGQRGGFPSSAQRCLGGGGEPGPLGRGQPPGVSERSEELADGTAAIGSPGRGPRLVHARGGGRRFHGWFSVRFGCNRCTPFPRQLHPSARWLHPVPGAGCTCCTPSGQVSTASTVAAGCGARTPPGRPLATGCAAEASLVPNPEH